MLFTILTINIDYSPEEHYQVFTFVREKRCVYCEVGTTCYLDERELRILAALFASQSRWISSSDFDSEVQN